MLRSHAARACALAIAVAALGTACGGDDEPDAAPAASTTTTTTTAGTVPASGTSTTEAIRTIEVGFAGGQVTGGVRRESVDLGQKVRIRVTSDVADELHVHTYDAIAAVTPGQPGEVEFTASIPGRHEVELEDAGRQVLVIEVR
jgi:hypothetical protein